ncbi:FKBP-type peptidyl-prolyl cis-trans isomerase [Actinoallomurus sp. NPDC050550]|uniref:FKBP-type peptidyl-prolyl cis-trans isomerase n=1 Tax=Actinoallomurus sp. NPDC050550 TaxID=3154937 RepID=UPI0033D4D041
MRRVAALAVLPLAAVTACSGGDLPDGLKVAGVVGRQPTVTIPGSSPSGKLKVETLRKGKGPEVTDGDLVVANYVGYRWNGGDHKLVASSYDAGRPAMFPYGRLVTGLNKALEGQRPGGRVLAVIPPNQGYGAGGYAPWQIGANDSMVFVLDVIATYHNGASAQGQSQLQNDPAMPQVTPGATPTMKIPSTAPPGRLRVRTIIQGSGPPVQAHQLVVFHDLGQVWRTGKVFEDSRGRGRPDSVVAGAGQMISGWDRAVVGQRVGSRVLVVIPSKDGYGAKGHAASGIEKNDTLAFVIDVLAAY